MPPVLKINEEVSFAVFQRGMDAKPTFSFPQLAGGFENRFEHKRITGHGQERDS